MRHRVDHRKLGRTASHRRALMRSMVTSLFLSERITTTGPKAKEARRFAERLITRAKKGYRAHQESTSLQTSGKDGEAKRQQAVALAHWRQAGRFVRSPEVLRKLFDQIAPLYLERNGGYTRIIRLDHHRVGDNARLVLLELVDTEVTKKPLIRGTVPQEAAPEKAPKAGRGRSKGAEGDAKGAKKEKKVKPGKESAREGGAKKDKAKDTKKSSDAGKRAAPKTRSKSRKSGE
jgi:large subunit ribosomal protein L17